MKTLVMIDGANASYTARATKASIDWKRFRTWVEEKYGFVSHFNYYTAIYIDSEGVNKIHKMLDFISYNGFCVISKPAKSYEEEGEVRIKGNMDVEIATDLLLHARNVDQILLFTGDNDFTYAVKAAQLIGTRVILLSTKEGNMVGADIRKAVDEFIEMREVLPLIRMEERKTEVVTV